MTAQLDLPWSGRGTLADRFAAWAGTPDGFEVIRACEEACLNLLRGGAKRISIARVFEEVRAARRNRLPMNNSYRAFIVRRLRELHPDLRDRIKVREQKAA